MPCPGAREGHVGPVALGRQALASGRRRARRSPGASSTRRRAPGSWATSARPATPRPRRPSPASRRPSAWSCTRWASPSTPSGPPAPPASPPPCRAPRGHRARRPGRGRVEPHGPRRVVARGRLAGVRRVAARHRPGHPGRGREHHLDAGVDDGPTVGNGGKRWDATKLGMQLSTDVFGTRPPGLRY